MNYSAVRSRYVDDSVATASPAQLLVMLYDRLALDLGRAEAMQREAKRLEASEHLKHAQDIVSELVATLDLKAWSGASQLMSVYSYLLTELIGASVTGDAERTAACRSIVEPLHDAWRQAAQETSVTTAVETHGGISTVPTPRGELGVG